MRKFISLIVAVLCSSIVFAQAEMAPSQKFRTAESVITKANSQSQKFCKTRDLPIWSCDFEEGCPEYTLAREYGYDIDWQIVSEQTYPEEMFNSSGCYFFPMNYSGREGISQAPQQISETPGHWALLDICSTNFSSATAADATITFTDINLTSCLFPKVSFLQSYRDLNERSDFMIIQTSTDGGFSWTSHEVNTEEFSNGSYVNGLVEVLIPEVGGHANVALRIRYQNLDGIYNDGIAWNYGWQIDDIKIVETPAHNLTINNARINMFGYIDYRNIPENYWTNMTDSAKRAHAYQYYDPYAQSPKAQWETSGGYAAFNVEYTNNGSNIVSPRVNIVVTSPSGTDIYNKTLTGSSISLAQRDTIDFATIDDETVFYIEDEPELGRYTVTFTVSEQGAVDANPDDNTIVQYFDITDGVFSKSYDEPTSKFLANRYTDSQSGDMYGAEFSYYYSPEKRMAADLYIAEGTTEGTLVKVCLYHTENGELVLKRESEWLEITADNIGTWNTFEFTEDYGFVFAEGEQYRNVRVMASASWDYATDKIYYGKSDILSTRGHNSLRYMSATDRWSYGSDDIAIRFYEAGEIGSGTITVLPNNYDYGEVSGGGEYPYGTNISISATPYSGYEFVSWNDGNTDNPRSITVTGTTTYIANFQPITYTIDVLTSNNDYGYTSGSGEYQPGEVISISATAYSGYVFASWHDDNTDNPRTITVTGNATYIASFTEAVNMYTINVMPANPNHGSVTGGGTYLEGSQVTIEATPNDGYRFVTWNDGNTDNPRVVTVTGETTYIANFELIPTYTITVLSNNESYGHVVGGGTYLEGSQVTIEATPNDGNRFVTWNDGNTDNPRVVIVTGEATYIANFEPIPTYTITVLSDNESYGHAVGGGTYLEGTSVTIRAIPASGYVFTSWYDGNVENPRTIIVTGDATYIAYFADITSVTTYTIDVISANEEQGNVTGSGIYAEGTIITIGAIPRTGYRFKQWNDGNTDNPRTITVTEDLRYIASFELIPTYTITVLSANEAFGHVTGGGIYPEGSIVTITAIPSPRYEFTQWNDGNTDNPRQITVVGDATYIATFNRGNGIEESINHEISIYPNPTSDVLFITSSETIASVEIVSITGQLVSRMELCNDNVACNVENLKAGMYFIKIRCKSLNGEEGLAIIKKFVKE